MHKAGRESTLSQKGDEGGKLRGRDSKGHLGPPTIQTHRRHQHHIQALKTSLRSFSDMETVAGIETSARGADCDRKLFR